MLFINYNSYKGLTVVGTGCYHANSSCSNSSGFRAIVYVWGKVFDLPELVSLHNQRGLTHVRQTKLVLVELNRILLPFYKNVSSLRNLLNNLIRLLLIVADVTIFLHDALRCTMWFVCKQLVIVRYAWSCESGMTMRHLIKNNIMPPHDINK